MGLTAEVGKQHRQNRTRIVRSYVGTKKCSNVVAMFESKHQRRCQAMFD